MCKGSGSLKKRRLLSAAVTALLALVMIFSPFSAQVALAEGSGLDIVFVIDDTRSMKQNDPQRLSADALRQFVDILPRTGDQVGIVTYALDVMEKMSLREIRDDNDKQEIKDFAAKKITQEGRCTDTAAGLAQAAEYLDLYGREGCTQAIILVTDGENDFSGVSRTAADSDAVLQTVLTRGYPVYAIGLNAENSGVWREYITNITSSTGGEAYFPSSSGELGDIFLDIQSTLLGTSSSTIIADITADEFTPVSVDIPDNVFEANLQINHSSPIELRLSAPDGSSLALDSPNVVVSDGESYTNVKLLSPEQGLWTLELKGTTAEKVKINLIYNYEITVELAAEKRGDSVAFTARLHGRDDYITDKAWYSGASASLSIKTAVGTGSKAYSMTNVGSFFELVLDLGDGDYEVTAEISSDRFVKSSETLSVSVPLEQSPSETPGEESRPEDKPDAEKSRGLKLWQWIAIGFVAAAAIVFVVLRLLSKKSATFEGQFKLELENLDTGEWEAPIYRTLDRFGGKTTLHHVLSLLPEYASTAGVILRARPEREIAVKNSGGVEIYLNRLPVKPGAEDILRKGGQLKVCPDGMNIAIYLTYI